MGGYGSGNRRPRANARPLTIKRLRLDVGAFRRAGLPLDVVAPNAGALQIRARGDVTVYTWQPVEPSAALEGGPVAPAGACLVTTGNDGPPLRVPLDWHRVGYGWRPLWRCPTCGARVRILYGPTPAAAASSAGRAPLWTCRTCAALAYESTRAPDYKRARERASRAAAALGMADAWTCGNEQLFRRDDWQPRPFGMHWRTWRRRLEDWRRARLELEAALCAELARGWTFGGAGAAMNALRRDALAQLAAARAERRAARGGQTGGQTVPGAARG